MHVVPSRPGRDVDPAQLAASPSRPRRGRAALAELELGPRQPDLTTAEGERARDQDEARLVHDPDGRLVVEPDPQRPPDGRLHRRHHDPARARSSRSTTSSARAPPSAASSRAQEIIGSLVLPSIGGGVCQTATTLFNDAFEAGLPILERTNHNLYLSHYPLGRDATVAWGGPDLKFSNDLKHGILIKASYTDPTLTFTFYGTPEGRKVVSTTSAQTNWTSPGMNYAARPERAARTRSRS